MIFSCLYSKNTNTQTHNNPPTHKEAQRMPQEPNEESGEGSEGSEGSYESQGNGGIGTQSERERRFVDFLIAKMHVLVKDMSRVDSNDIRKCYTTFLEEMEADSHSESRHPSPTSHFINAMIKRGVEARCGRLNVDAGQVLKATTWRVGASTTRGKAYRLSLLSETPSARLSRLKHVFKVVRNEKNEKQVWKETFLAHASNDTDSFLAFCESEFANTLLLAHPTPTSQTSQTSQTPMGIPFIVG